MCKDNRISERMSKGVLIDAPFPRNMELAYKILKKEGYCESRDFLEITSQHNDQLTMVKYNKSTTYGNSKDGKASMEKHFVIVAPDRYIPISEGKQLEDVVRSEEDI